MNDIHGGEQQPDLGAARDHQRLVHVQQIIRHGLGVYPRAQLTREIGILFERGEEIHALACVHVLVLPFPLEAGDADGELGVARVFLLQDQIRGGNRHDHQNDYRNDGPDDLDLGAMHHGGVRDGAFRVAECHHRIDHHAEYHDGDADADPEHFHVQGVHVLAQIRDAHRQVIAVRGVGAGRIDQADGGESSDAERDGAGKAPWPRNAMVDVASPDNSHLNMSPIRSVNRFQAAATRSCRPPNSLNAWQGGTFPLR